MKILGKHSFLIFLTFTILIGAFFRFYMIGETPSGFYVDEASLGYNAFSILKTGKDEYGKAFPAMFRSFATFQSPIYTYLSVPFVAIFGLNPLSTRFLSALVGLLSLPLLYLLVRNIAPDKYKNWLAAISTLFLAVSPWHIAYSRTTYETTVALFFLLLGSLMFFYSLKKTWLLVLSALFFAISFTAYRAETLVAPLLVVLLFLRFKKNILSSNASQLIPLALSLILGLLLVLPTVSIIRTPGFQARSSSLNIFSFTNQTPWGFKSESGTIGKILNTPPLLSTKEFISLYTAYLSPRYMFQLGDAGPRRPYPDLGTFFAWQFPFYLAGIYFLLKEKEAKKLKSFVFILLLVSPIPAALTRDPYSTLRSLQLVIPQTILIAFGFIKFWNLVSPTLNKLKYAVIGFLILYSTLHMYISIFYLNDYFTSHYWNYGWKETLDYIPKLDPNLPIIVDASRGDAYILLLFFLKYDPATYQKDNFEVPISEYYTNMTRNTTKNIGRLTVKNFKWGIDTDHVDQYIIADNIAIGEGQIQEHHLIKVHEILLPNSDVALRILKTNPTK